MLTYVAYALLAGGVILGLGIGIAALVDKMKNSTPKRKVIKQENGVEIEHGLNTDKAVPVGFSEHYKLIMMTAPTADPSTREKYALEGLSEAAILVSERKRLENLIEEIRTNPEDDKEVV